MSRYNHVHIRGIIVKKTVVRKGVGSFTVACQTISGRPTEQIELDYLLRDYRNPDTPRSRLIHIIDTLSDIYKNDKKLVITNHPVIQFNKMTQTSNADEIFKAGDRVIIDGHLESYLRYDADGSSRMNLFIYADTINFDTSKFENFTGERGRIYPAPENDVYLTGIINSISKRGEHTVSMDIRPMDSPDNIIPVVKFRAEDSLFREFHKGDTVSLLATIQSVDTRKNPANSQGKKPGINFHRIVVSNMTHYKGGEKSV